MTKICKWYNCCPIKIFVEEGKISQEWEEKYCLIGNKACQRYQLEEKGIYHPDNMLPNGKIIKMKN